MLEHFLKHKSTYFYIVLVAFLWIDVLGANNLKIIGAILLFGLLPGVLLYILIGWLSEHISEKYFRALAQTLFIVFHVAILLDIIGSICD